MSARWRAGLTQLTCLGPLSCTFGLLACRPNPSSKKTAARPRSSRRKLEAYGRNLLQPVGPKAVLLSAQLLLQDRGWPMAAENATWWLAPGLPPSRLQPDFKNRVGKGKPSNARRVSRVDSFLPHLGTPGSVGRFIHLPEICQALGTMLGAG